MAMPKRREVLPVTINAEQRRRLENLWFVYGNAGKLMTPANHSFIQRIIENGYDERPLITKRTPKYRKPTAECEAAVDRILKDTAVENKTAEQPTRSHLKIVTTTRSFRPSPQINTNLKDFLENINHRNRQTNITSNNDDDTPDAA
jgi:hypothetical protein